MPHDSRSQIVGFAVCCLGATAFVALSASAQSPLDRFRPDAGDPDALNPPAVDPGRAPVCLQTPVRPSIATDDDRIVFVDDNLAQPGMSAVLRGVRFNGFGPGAEPEEIYCGCQPVTLQLEQDPDQDFLVPAIRVPDDAPSGQYSIELLPRGATCESGGIRASCEVPQQCIAPTLTVAPSHVAAVMKGLIINDNGEDSDIHPAEMQFVFAGASGSAFGDGDRLVQWSGGFPAGSENASHLTHGDQSILSQSVPLFAGRESQMSASECREECVALPASKEQACLNICASNESAGRYNNLLEFGLTGFEADSSPSKAWGFIAGAAAAAGTCYAFQELGRGCFTGEGVGTSLGIGGIVAAGVNELLEDEDDKFGFASEVLNLNDDWGIGVEFPPIQFKEGTGGDIALEFETRRIAAPSLLHYSVTLRSITINEGYELGGCEPPNEVFVQARANFQVGQSQLGAPIRVPEGNDVLSLDEGETRTLSTSIFSSGTLLPENAAEVPFLYLETSVWERDEENDLLGFGADIIELAPIVARFTDFDTTPDGFLFWRGTQGVSQIVSGFGGSDDHCSIFAIGVPDKQGGATVAYDVTLSWLPAPPGR